MARIPEPPAERRAGEEGLDPDRTVAEPAGHAAAETLGDTEVLGSGSALAPGSTPATFGPYRLEGELGRGGQGVVYRAYDPRLNRRVALKVLLAYGAGSEALILRFRREAAVAAHLDHPCICAVHESGTWNGVPYIAMQLVEGESLARHYAAARAASRTVTEASPKTSGSARTSSLGPRTRPELMRLVQLVEKVAHALHAAHLSGIVHRDIKPGNIMVRPDGDPVVLDFGLARTDDDDLPALTGSGDLFGTPAYMSPEQLTRKASLLDGRTDVYSLGVTLYEGLAGMLPFHAATRESLYQSILTRDPPDLRRLNPLVPTDLKVVVETALEKAPERRYRTAADFAEDLRRVRKLEPIRARPVGPVVKLWRWAQRNPRLAASVAFAFVSLLAGLVVTSILLRTARNERDAKDVALTKEQVARAEREVALAGERQALQRYERMADVARVADLLAREERLWPLRASVVPAMEAWLADARAVLDSLSDHHAELEALAARALPYTVEDQEDDEQQRRELHRDHFNLVALNRQLVAGLQTALISLQVLPDDVALGDGNTPGERLSRLEAELASAKADLEKLLADPRCSERLTWRFADPRDGWRHGVLTRLVLDLRRLRELVLAVEDRRQAARQIERVITESAAVWERCRREIAADPRYRGLDLPPQPGLVPLGRDRESGLMEFWHLASGRRPIWEGEALAGSARRDHESAVILVLLPGGKFTMGGQGLDPAGPNFDAAAVADEWPHEVELDAFFIAKHEITQAQWQRIMGSNPSRHSFAVGDPMDARPITASNPVETVSHDDARRWAARMELSLPTEAQWEYAARGGTVSPWWTGSATPSLQGAANLADAAAQRLLVSIPCDLEIDDGHLVHAEVGSFAPNPFGLHDILGNVREWCLDGHQWINLAHEPGDGLRAVHLDLSTRVVRGGGFNDRAIAARASFRTGAYFASRSPDLGFRPVRVVDRDGGR